MFKIGEFSRLAQVPVATLRYYDQIGLLQPVEVDRATGYRSYSASQLMNSRSDGVGDVPGFSKLTSLGAQPSSRRGY
jgi:MerR family regulatory protein